MVMTHPIRDDAVRQFAYIAGLSAARLGPSYAVLTLCAQA
jgi:hypothetical protein